MQLPYQIFTMFPVPRCYLMVDDGWFKGVNVSILFSN